MSAIGRLSLTASSTGGDGDRICEFHGCCRGRHGSRLRFLAAPAEGRKLSLREHLRLSQSPLRIRMGLPAGYTVSVDDPTDTSVSGTGALASGRVYGWLKATTSVSERQRQFI